MFNKKSKLSPREHRYCSCLLKVRGKSKPLRSDNIQNPYGICTNSVYNLQDKKRTKRIGCLKNYDLNSITFYQLKALAIEKKIKVRDKGRYISKKKILNRLKRFRT